MCDNSGDNGLAHRELLCPKDVSHLTKVGVCVIPILGVDPQAWSQSAMGCVVLISTGPSPWSPLWTTKWYTELSAVSLPESILFWPPSTTGTQSLEEHGCSCHCRKPHLNPPWVAHTSNLKCFVGSITCSDWASCTTCLEAQNACSTASDQSQVTLLFINEYNGCTSWTTLGEVWTSSHSQRGHLVGNIVSQSLPSGVLATPVGHALRTPSQLPSQHVLGDGIPPQRSETQDLARCLSLKYILELGTRAQCTHAQEAT